MFILLLIGKLLLSLVVTYIVVRIFKKPVSVILERIIPEEISFGWTKYTLFSLYVAGISSGTRVWDLERYIDPGFVGPEATFVLNTDRVALESYRAIVFTLQGVSSVLLVFFVVTLIAYVVVRIFEARTTRGENPHSGSGR